MLNLGQGGDTICALSSAPGLGGISVIRVSGPRSFELARTLGPGLPNKPESHRVYLSDLLDTEKKIIDQSLFTFFEEGRSFTGEETVEISCHGSPTIVTETLRALVAAGARTAGPGEFTFRAFMNGRIDLVQAEGVLALIESRSKLAARVAARQLQGDLSKSIARIEAEVLWLLSRLEASIDFSMEDLPAFKPEEAREHFSTARDGLEGLLKSYQAGRLLREGLRVALVGMPNVGKSSLLNRVLGRDRAIVAEVAGTTRDTIEADVIVNGVLVTFVDTAGLRDTEDVVEKMGVERSRAELEAADLVVLLFDLKMGFSQADFDLSSQIAKEKLFVVGTKLDLIDSERSKELIGNLRERFPGAPATFLSNTTCEGIESFREVLAQRTLVSGEGESGGLIYARHFEMLSKASEALERAEALRRQGASVEFISLELRDSLSAIHEVLGKRFDDDIIDRIFKDFCIGK